MRAKHGVVVIKPKNRTIIFRLTRRKGQRMNVPELTPNRNPINEQELMYRFGIGRYGNGNIDLYNRPRYMNPDGAVSTVRSMSFNDGSGEILVPTIAFHPQTGKPYLMSDDEAINRYYNTGEYLGKFKTVDQANDYADRLHKQQQHIYQR